MRARWMAAGLVALAMVAQAAGAEGRKLYVFGNSLVYHLSDGPETAVPWWLARMAKTAGHGFAGDGEWGFLRDFAARPAPKGEWALPGVERGWGGAVGFEDAGWDAILIAPANFIQLRGPERPYEGDNPGGDSPLSAALALIDRHPGVPVLIYEGWAEMSAGFPPRRRAFADYNAMNRGEYHDWYVDFTERLRAARPGREIGLVPVASVLADLFSDGALAGIDPRALYVDADPHGTPTLYLLAAMVTYSALYGEPAPAVMELPEDIAPQVRAAYPLLAAQIARAMAPYRLAGLGQGGKSVAADRADAVARPAPPTEVRAVGLPDPGLAMGLNGISDWSTEQPFVDIMKSARPWLGHQGAQWGAWGAARLAEGGYLDENGWVTGFPPGVDRIESFVLSDQDAGATAMAGRYRVRWQGEGVLKVGGRVRDARYGDHEAWFHYTPGEGEVAITLHSTDPEGTGDPIRNIEIVREDQIPLSDLGVTFNPDWLARIADLRGLRFMDWMMTNGSPVTTWQGRPRLGDFSYAWRGVPAEAIIELANLVGADPWFCLPHGADDGYVRALAEMVEARLDPRLRVHVEFSNELWNFIFPQARWAAERAEALWGAGAGDDAWMQAAGLRAAETMRIWSEVFADAPGRLVRVVAVHTGWPGLEEAFLDAPLGVAEGAAPPGASFDAYAVSGYFGFELGDGEEGRLADLKTWIAESEAAARAKAEAQGLKFRALRVAVKAERFDGAIPLAAEAVREGSLKELTGELWPYHAKAAGARGLRLIMYEGGSHVVGAGAAVNDDDLTAFFADFSYSPAMAGLYREALGRWRALAGGPFNAFVDVARGSRHGHWGALRHLQDDNPRWAALMAANAKGAGARERRAPGSFLQGVLRRAGAAGAVLEGTEEEDILLGGPGDDRLIGHGGGDALVGGPGQDVALLPGARDDYSFAMEGPRLLALRGGVETRLRGIEALEFEGEPGRAYRLDLPN